MKSLAAILVAIPLLTGCSKAGTVGPKMDPGIEIVLSEVLVSEQTGCAFAIAGTPWGETLSDVKVRVITEMSKPTCPIQPEHSVNPPVVDEPGN